MHRSVKLAIAILILSTVIILSAAAADIGVGIQFNAENFNAEKMDFYPGFNVQFIGGTGYVGGMLTFDLVSEGSSNTVYGLADGDRARLASLFLVGQYTLGKLTLYAGPGVGAYLDKDSTMYTTIQDEKMFYTKIGLAYRLASVNIFLDSIFYTYVAPFQFAAARPRIVLGASYMF